MKLPEFSCAKGPVARLGADVETQGTKGLFPVSVAVLTQADAWPAAPHLLWTAQNSHIGKEHSPACFPSLNWHCITRLSATGCGILWDAAGAGASSDCGVPTLSVNPRDAAQWDGSFFPHSEATFPLSSAAHQFFSFTGSQLSFFHPSHVGFSVL